MTPTSKTRMTGIRISICNQVSTGQENRVSLLRISSPTKIIGGSQKGGFPKGWFWRMFRRHEKPERGYVRMFRRNENWKEGTLNENRKEGTFACSCGTKTGMRAHSPKPPFYETALLSPGEIRWKLSDTGDGRRIGILKSPSFSLCPQPLLQKYMIRLRVLISTNNPNPECQRHN